MKINTITALSILSFFYLIPAHALPDPGASTVTLKTDCGTATDCFTNMPALLDWTWNTRAPSATAPLSVNIGPGSFDPIHCTNNGNVTFTGSGREATKLSGFIGSDFSNCVNIEVKNLHIKGSLAGVTWFGGGNSNWVNVHITSLFAAWYDAISSSGLPCNNGDQGRHTYFSSTLEVTNASFGGSAQTFLNACGSNWLFGSEVLMHVSNGGNGTDTKAIFSNGPGNEVHLYGSNVRVTTDAGAPIGTQTALLATNSGEIHSHGTGIDVIAENANTVIAISADSGALVHASESAYVLKTAAGGTKTRIVNNGGIIKAPHQWEENSRVPDINSVTGADTAIVTSTNDGQPHMVIYSDECSTKWYDMVTANCI